MGKLHGIIPPVVTPLTADERLDEAGLERQLQRMMDAGVHGLFFLGSTGEEPLLRFDVKQQAIRAAVRIVGGRIPVVVGCMAEGTTKTIDNIRQAAALGVDAVAVTPPCYFPSTGPTEQLAHYRACVAASDVPLIIYNIPQTTKVMVSPETTAEISSWEGVAGLKDSSTDFTHFLRLVGLVGGQDDFSVLIGSPNLTGAAVLCGGDGGVPGIANLDPKLMVDVYDAARAGDLVKLQALQIRVLSLFRAASFGAPIACLKAGLELMGVCESHTAGPLLPLTPDSREQLAALLREHDLL